MRHVIIIVFYYFCIWIETSLLRHINKEEALCLSCNFENVGNFQKNVQGWHSGSHAIAWAVIVISVHSGFLRPSKLRRDIAAPRFVV